MTLRPADKKRDVVLVFGKTGMGKTEWTKGYVRTLPRVLALDPMLEYDSFQSFDDMTELVDHVKKYRTWKVRTEFAPDFDLLTRTAWAVQDPERPYFSPHGATLLIEEAARVIPPGLFKMPQAFVDIIYRGRHRLISVVIVSQRAHTVHIMPRSQWTRMIVFKQSEAQDVTWIRNVTGFNLDARELGKLEYFDVTPSGWKRRRINFAGDGKHATMSDVDISPPDPEDEGGTEE